MSHISAIAKYVLDFSRRRSVYLIVGGILVLYILRRLGRRRYLTGMDAMFANANKLTAPHCMVYLRTRPSALEIRQNVEKNLLRYSQFKQIMVNRTFLWPYWKESTAFDLDDHFFVHQEPYTQSSLQEFTGNALCTTMDPSKPLWQFHLFQNIAYISDGEEVEGAVLMLKFHHALADGITMLKVVIGMSTVKPGCEAPPPTKDNKMGSIGLLLKTAARIPSVLAKYFLLPSDPVSPARHLTPRNPHNAPAVCWSEDPVKLRNLKTASKTLGVTVNDILVASVAVAYSHFIAKARAERPDPKWTAKLDTIQTVLWVSLIPLNFENRDRIVWGNHIAGIYIRLPVDQSSPLTKLKVVSEMAKSMYGSPEPLLSNLFTKFFGTLPPVLGRLIWNNVAFKVTNSVSTVPGPRSELLVEGHEIDRMQFVTPAESTIGSFVTMFSYADKVTFGISADPALIPRPGEIVGYFHEAVEGYFAEAAALRAPNSPSSRNDSSSSLTGVSSASSRDSSSSGLRSPSPASSPSPDPSPLATQTDAS